MIRQVPQRFGPSSGCSTEGVGNTFIELLVLAMQGDNRALNSSQSSVRRAHLARVERFVKQNIGNPKLSIEMIAGACNISVRYLHTLFQGQRDLDCALDQGHAARGLPDATLAREKSEREH